jgi:hypothetical protein
MIGDGRVAFFDAAVPFVVATGAGHHFPGNPCRFEGGGIGKKVAHLTVERALVAFERKQVIRLRVADGNGDLRNASSLGVPCGSLSHLRSHSSRSCANRSKSAKSSMPLIIAARAMKSTSPM